MLTATFLVTTAAAILLVALLCWSVAKPAQRIWPPPSGQAGWQFWLVWALIGLLIVGMLYVGIADYGSLGLDAWPWRVVGGILVVLGNALAWWGVASLGGRPTTGMAGDLVTGGPYRFTRNPQYIGDILIIAGFVLAANSWLALLPAILAAISAFIAPFAEEPWLEARLGDAYCDYKRRVPRFI
ncbi:methyltransferase family protein [Chelativorans intermedius]|uniref:Methyltransferase family protein n=1 Tax=Chelativorans intermedius TaxID=515947 RepID=A0ABV6DCR5_9HYPH|nr:isoprenylcysteine carboxylmethyltransferase family protein [Chelativorans intermedius]MCT9000464.1 isoprenylcysteine carboxylmethyltransferase family protein [Chelativorans intermedius]